MGVTRDTISLIHAELAETLPAIAERADTFEDGQEAIRQALNAGIWEALYTLANHIDDLRG